MFTFDAFFCILYCVSIKDSYQTPGGNIITSQLVIKNLRTVLRDCGVFSWLTTRSLTRAQIHRRS